VNERLLLARHAGDHRHHRTREELQELLWHSPSPMPYGSGRV
jgi:hypothetical protein